MSPEDEITKKNLMNHGHSSRYPAALDNSRAGASMKAKFINATASVIICMLAGPAGATGCEKITDGMNAMIEAGQVRDFCLSTPNERVQEVEAGASTEWKVGVGAWRDRIIVLRGTGEHAAPLNVLLYTDRGERYELHFSDRAVPSSPASSVGTPPSKTAATKQ